jgi:hypothetical protein
MIACKAEYSQIEIETSDDTRDCSRDGLETDTRHGLEIGNRIGLGSEGASSLSYL